VPLPLLLGFAAGAAAITGLVAGTKGVLSTKNAKNKINSAKQKNNDNLAMFEDESKKTNTSMESLGKEEMEIATSFGRFERAFEKIKNKPEFSKLNANADIPKFNFNEIKTVSVTAGAFLGAAGGAAASAVFASAASAGTMAAVMALGTASTGTAISALSGAAATNAALAALGGGTIAAGGGGMALGSIMLSLSTAGVGVLVGGIVLAITGGVLESKAEEVHEAMLKNEREINKSISLLKRIRLAITLLHETLLRTAAIYEREITKLETLVARETDWNHFSTEEQLLVENNILIVTILNKMINTPIIKATKINNKGELEKIDVNDDGVKEAVEMAKNTLTEKNI